MPRGRDLSEFAQSNARRRRSVRGPEREEYRPAFFRFAGKVKIDPAYEPELVLAQVELALRDGFSFARREFGQPVMLSEVIAAIQAVAGVIAVDVDKLYRSDKAATLEQRLLAEAPVTPANGDVAGGGTADAGCRAARSIGSDGMSLRRRKIIQLAAGDLSRARRRAGRRAAASSWR